MTRNGKFALGVAGAVFIAGAGGAMAFRHGPGGGHGGWGKHGGMGFPMLGQLCRGDAAEKADLMLVRAEYKIKPTDAQKPAFDELKTAVRTAAAKIAAACPPKPERSADGSRQPKPPTERLAQTEATLAATLDAVRTVRPAVDKLYASLSDEQKKAVTERGGWRGKRGWGNHRDRDDDRGGRRERGPGGERGEQEPDGRPPAPDQN